MRAYYLIAGAAAVLYYLVLVLYAGRLRVTFAPFWLITGGVHLFCGCAPFSCLRGRAAIAVVCAAWLLFLSVESRIFRFIRSRTDTPCGYVIILGAQVRGRRVTDSLRRRLEAALEYLRRFPESRAIVSGGKGPEEEISEAEAMAAWLESHGVEKERILLEDRSVSTRENLRFSRACMDQKWPEETGGVLIVSNGFHLYRASLIAKSEGYVKPYFLAASVDPVFHLNYLVREFFALLAYSAARMKARVFS